MTVKQMHATAQSHGLRSAVDGQRQVLLIETPTGFTAITTAAELQKILQGSEA